MHRDGLDQRASEPVRIRRRSIAWLLWTTALSVFLLAVTAPSLADYPRVSGDDSWVMSASYKLATQGVLGSDLYAGFYGAEQHYFIALPVYHVLQAAVFWMFDAGVAQARAVTLASALVVLGTVSWLAYRWFGAAVAGISGVLLVFWRTDLLAIWPGLPLLSVARTGRYDMTGVAFAWLAIAFLDQSLRRPARSARWPALATGLCAGLATLSQFFGAFTIPLIAVLLPWQYGQRAMLSRTTLWIAAGFALVVLPYLGYVVPHWDDFVGQSSLKADRAQFDRPSFYVDNLRDESQRYAHL